MPLSLGLGKGREGFRVRSGGRSSCPPATILALPGLFGAVASFARRLRGVAEDRQAPSTAFGEGGSGAAAGRSP